MSKKLAAKAGLIQALNLPPVTAQRAAAEPSQEVARPKTAPGSMLQFMSTQSAAIKEAEDLKERLRAFDGASPVRLLDPQTIRPSKWANRHDASFESADFAELKSEIESAGGNVQPVRVRPLPRVLNGSTTAAEYEIVFGHRRHRACLELGIPVRALVEDASDQELFEAMERENRGRKNLSAWEQGCMYRKALDEGLYPSLRKLAESVKVDVSLVSKSVSLARLPEAVVAAFPSPLDIQFRWAQPLAEALQKDPDGVLQRAKRLKEEGRALTPVQVFERLCKPEEGEVARDRLEVSSHRLLRQGKLAATVQSDAKGRVTVKLEPSTITPERYQALLSWLDGFVKT
ncbi:ParB/RepB/Spo0J family partition protein [Ideonella dechloratans]|uniref:ParB/RepB/Spo0J family partition protein n=1 Tax=Ideonella dechloratans TaxID=36863 RepID=UPI0035B41BF5